MLMVVVGVWDLHKVLRSFMLPYRSVSQPMRLGGRMEMGVWGRWREIFKIRTSFSDKCDIKSYTAIMVTSYRNKVLLFSME